jgi:hypothetical protein
MNINTPYEIKKIYFILVLFAVVGLVAFKIAHSIAILTNIEKVIVGSQNHN